MNEFNIESAATGLANGNLNLGLNLTNKNIDNSKNRFFESGISYINTPSIIKR